MTIPTGSEQRRPTRRTRAARSPRSFAWKKGLPPPRWYKYNNTALAGQVFKKKVLGERGP
jgi:hypothetical protein